MSRHTYKLKTEADRQDALYALGQAPDSHMLVLRKQILLVNEKTRKRALGMLMRLPLGWIAEIKKRNRTLEQNDKLWVLLTIISKALVWHGKKRTPNAWKCFFMDALEMEMAYMPDEFGGNIPMGYRSSLLTIKECSLLIKLIHDFADKYSIDLREPEQGNRIIERKAV